MSRFPAAFHPGEVMLGQRPLTYVGGDTPRPEQCVGSQMSETATADGRQTGAAAERSGSPGRAGLVLGALIAVAAVANLGLAVANVALPSIGKHFDASQTALNLIAVGYSLGLAASVLYFGAVGDRYGRKLLLVLGMVLTDPGRLPRRLGAVDRRPVRRAHLRRARGGHGVPDDAGADHRALGRAPARTKVDRAVGGDRRRDRRARPALLRDPARALLVGLGVPAHAAAGGDRAA